jgi:hypothetical protein
MMTNLTRITFALPVTALAKECMTVLLATSAKELAVIQSSTGMTIMSNVKKIAKIKHDVWTFPPATGAKPWTAKQIKAYQQAQRAQLPESPM